MDSSWEADAKEQTMSATAIAAKLRLASLNQQQQEYRNKLESQQREIRRLEQELLQTQTVLDVTLPREIRKAQREYLITLYALDRPQQTISAALREPSSLILTAN